MPTHRQRAAAASAETRSFFAALGARSGTSPVSYSYPFTEPLPALPDSARRKLRSAVMEGDPFDIAVDWQNYTYPSSAPVAADRAPPVHYRSLMQSAATDRILVLNTCNEKKPGGDWDGGVLGLGAEESLARRSNLVQTLVTTDPRNPQVTSYYPLAPTAGVYSPNVVVFRAGHERDYALWPEAEWTALSVVSVAAVRRPKTDETGTRYSFSEERDLQREKMKTILRVAAWNGHVNLVLGGFGSCGPGMGSAGTDAKFFSHPNSHRTRPTSSPSSTAGISSSLPHYHHHSNQQQLPPGSLSPYKNPIKDVCKLWRELLCESEEFQGYFGNVVFAVSGGEGGGQREFKKYFG